MQSVLQHCQHSNQCGVAVPVVTYGPPMHMSFGIMITRDLALASMVRDDPPASSTASNTAAAMRGKVGSEFET